MNTKAKNGWISYKSGDKIHYKNDLVHREDGPAVIFSSGFKAWYIQGKRHRIDGPAVIYNNGNIEWWLNGKEYTFKGYCSKLDLSDEQIVKLTLKYNL